MRVYVPLPLINSWRNLTAILFSPELTRTYRVIASARVNYMSRHGKEKSKNYGYGNKLEYATKNALNEHYGGGHFKTVAAHVDRSRLFYDWLHSEYGIRDARKITNDIFLEYALYLKLLLVEGEIAISTATNRVSSVNVVLEVMRGDRKIRIGKIADSLGQKRSYIRRSIPDGMDLQQVAELRKQLIAAGYPRTAAIIWLARAAGMRLRECILADLTRLQREAVKGRINIQEGCKGGRSGGFAPRWVTVTDEIAAALSYARQVSPPGSCNLLEPTETYVQFQRQQVNAVRPLMQLNSIKGPHELRAAFACDRYMDLVGIRPPVFPRPENINEKYREAIRAARQIISHELGHGRIEVTNSYVGSENR